MFHLPPRPRLMMVLLLPVMLILLQETSGASAQTLKIEVRQELEAYRTSLQSLESVIGQSDPQLIEPLESIADRLMALNEYPEAHEVLDRAQQIIRVSEGLYTPSQHRILVKKIENWTNWGDWSRSREYLDHLLWLYTRNNTHYSETMVYDLLKTSNIHLRGVVEDDIEFRSEHYRSAAIHSRVALVLAENLWGRHDPRLGQLVYEQIKHSYLHSLEIQKRTRAGSQLRSVSLSTSDGNEQIHLDRGVARGIHRSNGYLYLEKLRRLYQNSESPNLEAVAMVTLYRADWQVLFQQREMALLSYAKAHDQLLAAGVPDRLVNELFASPSLIPESVFHSQVSSALASRKILKQTTLGPVNDVLLGLRFHGCSLASLPSSESEQRIAASCPDSSTDPSADPSTNGSTALFSFNLPGADTTRPNRVRGSREDPLGVAQNLHFIDANFSLDERWDPLVENLGWLRFRPKLIAGVPQAVTGILESKL